MYSICIHISLFYRSLRSFISFQLGTSNEETISTPFNVTHLLHVNPDNVEEFMSKLAESKTASTTKRPKILKSKNKDKEKGINERLPLEKDKSRMQTEEKQRSAPKPPARPVSCFVTVNSDQNFPKTGSPELYSSGLSVEQDIPPRPKPRPASLVLTANKDASEEQPIKEGNSTAAEGNVDRPMVDTFAAPKLPPRRPPRCTPFAAEKSTICDELDAKGGEDDSLYSTIDETAKIAVKPRTSVKNPSNGAVRPPLPPRQLSVKSSRREETDCTIPMPKENLPSPELSCQDGVTESVEKSDATCLPDSELPADCGSGVLFENADDIISGENRLPIDFDKQSPDLNDASSLYGVVNKPRSPRSLLQIANDEDEFLNTPLPGQDAPPLPPRTENSYIKKGPPLPPRPNLE